MHKNNRVNSNMATDTSLAAVFTDFQESGSSESDEEFYLSATSLAVAVYAFIVFMVYT